MFINKQNLEYLADLSRLKLEEDEKERLLQDIQKILDYFEELKEVNTENIKPMASGITEENVWREDEINDKRQATSDKRQETRDKRQETKDKLTEMFPEKKNGYLKVPPVFE